MNKLMGIRKVSKRSVVLLITGCLVLLWLKCPRQPQLGCQREGAGRGAHIGRQLGNGIKIDDLDKIRDHSRTVQPMNVRRNGQRAVTKGMSGDSQSDNVETSSRGTETTRPNIKQRVIINKTKLVDEELPSQQEKPYMDDFFQISDLRIYLQRPFYDGRHRARKLRFFGMVHRRANEVPIFCRFTYLASNRTVNVRASRFALFPKWPNINGKYHAYTYICKLYNNIYDMREVGVYASDSNVVTRIPVNVVSMEKKGDLAICLKATHGSLNATKLVEWFEFNRLLGVDKFLVYETAVHGPARRVLDYYRSKGLVDLIPYHFPLSMQKIETDTYGKTNDGWEWDMREQVFLVSLNDCVYRHRHMFKYIMVIDIDEVITPYKPEPLLSVIERADAKYPQHQGYTFLTAWHFLEYGISDPIAPGYLHMQCYNRRSPVLDNQPKTVYKTANVLAINWHNSVMLHPPLVSKNDAPLWDYEEYGYVHHYRHIKHQSKTGLKYGNISMSVVDSVIPRYRENLAARVVPVLKQLSLL